MIVYCPWSKYQVWMVPVDPEDWRVISVTELTITWTWKAKVARAPAPHQEGPSPLSCRESQGGSSCLPQTAVAVASLGLTAATCFLGADHVHLTHLSSGLLGTSFGVCPSDSRLSAVAPALLLFLSSWGNHKV